MQNKKIKFAILGTRGIPANYSGFETCAQELAIRFVEHEIETTVYCEKNPSGKEPDTYKGVKLVYVPSPKLGPLTTILYDLRCLWDARNKYDIVYMLGYGTSIFCFIPRLWGKEVWINMDGLEYTRAKWSWFAKLYLWIMEFIATITANRLIADSVSIDNYLRKKYKYLPPCSMISYGAYPINYTPDAALLQEWDIKPDDYYLVIARLEPENHVLEVLQGFAASKSKKKLIVLGNHKTGTTYVKALLNVQDSRIHLIGTVFDQGKLAALRSYAFAYFHGHSVGGTNPSLLEAMGGKSFIIAHDNPFSREVTRNSSEYFASPADIPLIVDKLESTNYDRNVVMKKMKEIVEKNYTWEQVTNDYLGLIHK